MDVLIPHLIVTNGVLQPALLTGSNNPTTRKGTGPRSGSLPNHTRTKREIETPSVNRGHVPLTPGRCIRKVVGPTQFAILVQAASEIGTFDQYPGGRG